MRPGNNRVELPAQFSGNLLGRSFPDCGRAYFSSRTLRVTRPETPLKVQK